MNLDETILEGKILDTFEIYFKKNIVTLNEIIIVKNNKEYFSLKNEILSEIKSLNISYLEKLEYYYFNKDELFLLEKEFNKSSYFKNKIYKKTFFLKNKKENYIILYLENIRLTFSIEKDKEYSSLREKINNESFNDLLEKDILNNSIDIITNIRSVNYDIRNTILKVAKELSNNNNLVEYIKNIENSLIVNNLKDNIVDFNKEIEKKEKSFSLEDGFFISDELNLNLKEIPNLYFEKDDKNVYFYLKNYDRYFRHYCSFEDFKEISKYHRESVTEKIKTEVL